MHADLTEEFHRLADCVSDEVTLREWWAQLHGAGLAFPTWPIEFGGRALPVAGRALVHRLLFERELPGPPHGIAVTMLAPTLLEHGNDDQRRHYLPLIARGEIAACQLFSEPAAGSDLASLRTRARRDGEIWIVDGQKVWSSSAHEADVGMLLARTDPDVPKHNGISFLLLPMHQDGVEVRPLRQMNGLAEFNEVFIDVAQAPPDALVGPLHGGWIIAQTTLAHERAAAPPRFFTAPEGEAAGWLDVPIGEVRRRVGEHRGVRMYSRSGRAAASLARARGIRDRVTADDIASLHTLSEISRWTMPRAAAGLPGGAQITKLQAAAIARRARDLDLRLLGAAGTLGEQDAPENGSVLRMALSAHVVSIGGGTDQIQKNILAERVLGLPREPDFSRSVPFRELPGS